MFRYKTKSASVSMQAVRAIAIARPNPNEAIANSTPNRGGARQTTEQAAERRPDRSVRMSTKRETHAISAQNEGDDDDGRGNRGVSYARSVTSSGFQLQAKQGQSH